MNIYQLHDRPELLDLRPEAMGAVLDVFWPNPAVSDHIPLKKDHKTFLARREAVIAASARHSYFWAKAGLKARFLAGEPAILGSPYALQYVKHVIRGPWPEAEGDFASSAWRAFEYAVVTGQRFPAGEAAIAKLPEAAFEYALRVITGRWPEGETSIATDLYVTLLYVNELLLRDGQRFHLGEPIMLKAIRELGLETIPTYYIKILTRYAEMLGLTVQEWMDSQGSPAVGQNGAG